jgi:hypothetical protein
MPHQVVYNLYPVAENLFLPSANVVQLDPGGQLAHVLQKALPQTISAYDIEPTPLLERMFRLIESLTPKAIEAKFKPPRARTAASLAQLLENPQSRPAVENFVYRQLDLFLNEIAANRLPLTFDAEKKTLAKDVQVRLSAEELIPHLAFFKTASGVDYRFQLGIGEKRWNIREREVVALTNTAPAWLLVDLRLYRVPGINGHMVRPFRQKDVVHIPADKARTYFRQFIAKNAGRTSIEAHGFAVRQSDRLLATRLEPVENVLENTWGLKPVFVYEGAEFAAGERRASVTSVEFPDDGEEVVVRQVGRNAALEAEQEAFLRAEGLVGNGRLFRLPDTAQGLYACIRWLTARKAGLEAAGFQTAPLREGDRTIALLQGDLQLRSEAAGDWFDVHGTIEAGAFRIPFRALIPFLRRGDRYFPLPDDTFLLLPEEWFAQYAELARALQDDGKGLRLPKTLFTLLQGAGLENGRDQEAFPVIDPDQIDYEPSPGLRATLRPYQVYGVKWLIGHFRHGFGACLADDMGLGKTLQTIALLLHAREAAAVSDERATSEMENHRAGSSAQAPGVLSLFPGRPSGLAPVLLVLPASLVFNWQQEFARFAPSLFVYSHTGPKRLRDLRALASHDVVLTTYHTVRQDLDLLQRINWHFIVLDESQQIKNRASEVARVVLSLPGRHKISLSGTPVENSLADLWTQMEFINPDTLGSFAGFREEFLLPIEKRGDDAAKQRLFSRLRPFFLRRTKEEVAPDLPLCTEQLFFTEMAAEQGRQYERTKSAVRNEILSLFQDPRTRLQALQALMRLRQLANHPVLVDEAYCGGSGKFDDVLAQWDTVRRAGHKVLFFSSFEKHLQLFRREFERTAQPYAWLTGDTPAPDRARAVERFQNEPGVQAFFMSIKAGGVGLNLTAADYVFLLDPWWNPAVEDQAIARAHRIGQQRPVTALRFIARHTIEEKILQLQERKKKLGTEFFAAGEEAPSLSREDMELLLG